MPLPSLTETDLASTAETVPSASAKMTRPVSRMATSSMPVETSGTSGTMQGVACFCMFEPMSARLASSWFKNGIIEVAMEKAWFVATSMKWTWSFGTVIGVPLCLTSTDSGDKTSFSTGVAA